MIIRSERRFLLSGSTNILPSKTFVSAIKRSSNSLQCRMFISAIKCSSIYIAACLIAQTIAQSAIILLTPFKPCPFYCRRLNFHRGSWVETKTPRNPIILPFLSCVAANKDISPMNLCNLCTLMQEGQQK